jgi:hypothetical protein
MANPFSGDRAAVRRASTPPTPRLPWIPYRSVAAAEGGTNLVILSHQLDRYWIHIQNARTSPCTGEGDDCWLSHAEYATRWCGFLFVAGAHGGRAEWTVITPSAAFGCPELLDPSNDLYGRVLNLNRTRKGPRAQLVARLDPRADRRQDLPPVPDMLSHLIRIWSAPPRSMNRGAVPKDLAEVLAKFERPRPAEDPPPAAPPQFFEQPVADLFADLAKKVASHKSAPKNGRP